MKRCINCVYCVQLIDACICLRTKDIIKIPHPYLMGGPRKCKCYTPKRKFHYPQEDKE